MLSYTLHIIKRKLSFSLHTGLILLHKFASQNFEYFDYMLTTLENKPFETNVGKEDNARKQQPFPRMFLVFLLQKF